MGTILYGAVLLFFIWFFGSIIIAFIETDDSDLSRFKRSGLKLHTDYKTGCQYFSSSRGGVYPRLDRNGKQICDTGSVKVNKTELDPT